MHDKERRTNIEITSSKFKCKSEKNFPSAPHDKDRKIKTAVSMCDIFLYTLS